MNNNSSNLIHSQSYPKTPHSRHASETRTDHTMDISLPQATPHGNASIPFAIHPDPFGPSHKGNIVYSKYWIEVAANTRPFSAEQKTSLQTDSSAAVRDFCKTIFAVDVRADSVDKFYCQAQLNAKAAGVD